MTTRRGFWVVGAVVAAIFLAVAWWLGSPLFLNETVDEAFPAVSSTAPTPPGESVVESQEVEAMEEEAIEEPHEGEAMGGETTEDEGTEEGAMAEATAMAEPTSEPTAEPTATPAGPEALLAGTFRDVDSVHRGSGSATIYALPDGSRTLRLEQFQVTNGPDLYVILVPRADPSADISGYVELAALKGNQGNQNYELPADLDLSGAWSVVIWCKAFDVNFSIASLAQP